MAGHDFCRTTRQRACFPHTTRSGSGRSGKGPRPFWTTLAPLSTTQMPVSWGANASLPLDLMSLPSMWLRLRVLQSYMDKDKQEKQESSKMNRFFHFERWPLWVPKDRPYPGVLWDGSNPQLSRERDRDWTTWPSSETKPS